MCTYTHPIVERGEERKEQLMGSPPKGQQPKQKPNEPISAKQSDEKEEEDDDDGLPQYQDALTSLKFFES